MRYNAFISYRHGELDGLVAENLHKMLETYHIPKKIADKTGKKRIERIFRDREELPTSSDLSGSINDALENSEFLILICSKRTCQSMWVMREVEYFIELHGHDRVVALLIDGEPDEAFPEIIRFHGEEAVEPLAADIRAETWAKSIKLLREEKLRLLAPVLGCAYDDLKQRHRERRRRLVTSVTAAAFAFLLAFGSFSFWQFLQISAEMQQKLKNQSYVLAEYAETALTSGDPVTAALLALEGLPNNLTSPERPYVAAAEKALANALGYYDVTPGFGAYRAVTLPAAASSVTLSPGETLAAVTYPYEVQVISTATGEVLLTRDTVASALTDVEFLSEDLFVYTGENGAVVASVSGASADITLPAATSIAVSGDKSTLALVYKDSNEAYIYDYTGRKISTIDFAGKSQPVPYDDTFLNPHDSLFTLNEDGSRLAVSFATGELWYFETASGTAVPVATLPGAVHYDGFFLGGMLVYTAVVSDPYKAYLAAYSLPEMGAEGAYLESASSAFIAVEMDGELYYANQNMLVKFIPATGEQQVVATFDSAVKSLAAQGGVFMAGLADGGYVFYDYSTARPVTNAAGVTYPMPNDGVLTAFSGEYVANFLALGADYALTGGYDSLTLRILKNKTNELTPVQEYLAGYSYDEVGVNADRTRFMYYSYAGFRTCDGAGGVLMEVSFDEPERVTDTLYDKAGGNLTVIYDDRVRFYDGNSGAVTELFGTAFVSGYGVHVYSPTEGIVRLVDPSTNSVVEEHGATTGADSAAVVGDYLCIRQDELLSIQNINAGGAQSLGERELKAVYARDDGSYLLALQGDGLIEVYSVDHAAVVFAFHIEITGSAEMSFLSGGRRLAVMPLHGTPFVYDVDKGTRLADLRRDAYLVSVEDYGEDYIISRYISSDMTAYALVLDKESLEAVAEIKGLRDTYDEKSLLIDDGRGRLYAVEMHSTGRLVGAAREFLSGAVLSDVQKLKYHV